MKDSLTIGIDFGTTNSFCSFASRAGLPQPITFPEQIRASFPTAIMYERRTEGGWSPTEFGRVAEEEWVSLSPSQQSAFRYVCNFKPDLSHSEEARDHARHFLHYLAAKLFDAETLHGVHLTAEMNVVIGVPARTLNDHAKWTVQLSREAGFKNVTTISEPKGALAYHLFSEHIRLRDLRASILVVDFGGGTCDFALLRQGEVVHCWGDPLFGGRLFDDLFYQWLKETNPFPTPGPNDAYIHWVKCRKAKEAFSLKMAKRREAPFHYHDFLGQGAMSGITWQQFLERAAKFEPTPELRRMLEAGANDQGRRFAETPLNLVHWFEKSLDDGLRSSGVRQSDIEFAILTGGSSLWPFVADALTENVGLNPKQILRANDPQMTVGMGICLLPDLRRRLTARRETLEAERGVIVHKIATAIGSQIADTTRSISGEAAKVLCESHIEPVMKELAESPVSWSIAEFRKQIEAACWAFEPSLDQIVCQKRAILELEISSTIEEQLQSWLSAHQIRWTLPNSDESSKTVPSVSTESMKLDPTGQIVATVGVISGIVLSVVSANLLGGAGIALLIAGPIGFLVGLMLGTLLSIAVYIWGREAAKSAVEGLPIPQLARRIILPRNTQAVRERIEHDIKAKVDEGLKSEEPRVKAELEKIIESLIGELNWVNLL